MTCLRAREFPAVQTAHFQAPPETLRGRIIPTITLATHRAFHLAARQCRLEFMAAVLTAPVGVKDHALIWRTPEPSHSQCVRHQ